MELQDLSKSNVNLAGFEIFKVVRNTVVLSAFYINILHTTFMYVACLLAFNFIYFDATVGICAYLCRVTLIKKKEQDLV